MEYIFGGLIALFFIWLLFDWAFLIPRRELKQLKEELKLVNKKYDTDTLNINNEKEQMKLVYAKRLKEIDEFYEQIQKMIVDAQNTFNMDINKLNSIIKKCTDNYLSVKEKYINDVAELLELNEKIHLVNKLNNYVDLPEYEFLHLQKISDNDIENMILKKFKNIIQDQYKYRMIAYMYPEIEQMFNNNEINLDFFNDKDVKLTYKDLFKVVNELQSGKNLAKDLVVYKKKADLFEAAKSNLAAIPYMAEIMADYETSGFEKIVEELSWGNNQERKRQSIKVREIQAYAEDIINKNKIAQYELAYLLNLFPTLQDIIDADYNSLPMIEFKEIEEKDYARDYLSKDEYKQLSETERNQLALNRYLESHKKTNWQIGRDYETYVGYYFTQQGYNVEYFGAYNGLEDLGRDIIAKKGKETLIIQCKYWSKVKEIHENHINQLYGTTVCYCIENKLSLNDVKPILITNISLSSMAKKMANMLGVDFRENFEQKEYPCIKCNINKNEYGMETKIYHLPFDQQYDSVKITKKGEFFAMTVEEAESKGFRRAFKWFGNN